MSKFQLTHCNGESAGHSHLGRGEMYSLKPFYDSSAPLDLPTTMYKLNAVYNISDSKNMHVVATPPTPPPTVVATPPTTSVPMINGECSIESMMHKKLRQKRSHTESNKMMVQPASHGVVTLDQLERRQMIILARLDSLRVEVDRLLNKRKTVSQPASRSQQCSAAAVVPLGSNTPTAAARLESLGISASSTVDLVVNADPASPPLSLFILFELLRRQFSVLPTCYTHSSLSSVKDSKLVSSVADMFRSSGGVATDRSKYQFGFTVIWKRIEKRIPSLTVDMTRSTPIVGESNIARFLARIIDDSFYDDENDIIKATRIDDIVDIAVEAITGGDASRLLSVLEPLKTRPWILGTTMSLADVVVWSALKKSIHGGRLQNGKGKIPEYVGRWMEKCSQRQEFLIVKHFIK